MGEFFRGWIVGSGLDYRGVAENQGVIFAADFEAAWKGKRFAILAAFGKIEYRLNVLRVELGCVRFEILDYITQQAFAERSMVPLDAWPGKQISDADTRVVRSFGDDVRGTSARDTVE
jgi:hypothetical protein